MPFPRFRPPPPFIGLRYLINLIYVCLFQILVFAGTFKDKIFGLKIIEGNFNGVSYRRHVIRNCLPEMRDINGGTLDGATWMQDGASIHRNSNFMDFLDEKFEGRVLAMGAETNGRNGHCWAPRFPDLTVCDFALWPVLKRRVYLHPRPKTLEELEEKIKAEIDSINNEPGLIDRCHLSVRKRANLYVQNNGGHFEIFK